VYAISDIWLPSRYETLYLTSDTISPLCSWKVAGIEEEEEKEGPSNTHVSELPVSRINVTTWPSMVAWKVKQDITSFNAVSKLPYNVLLIFPFPLILGLILSGTLSGLRRLSSFPLVISGKVEGGGELTVNSICSDVVRLKMREMKVRTKIRGGSESREWRRLDGFSIFSQGRG
jgi:hypothetical protein